MPDPPVEVGVDQESAAVVFPGTTVRDWGDEGTVAIATEVVAVEVPFAFVAVRVYIVEVESVGVVVEVPVTVPIVGLIESDVAPLTLQESVEVPFKTTAGGDALNEEIEGTIPVSVVDDAILEDAETLPTLSCAVT